ncbi:MAG: hypothetical protein IT285_16195 [Bdellovibrionales bacterium]|nr:hypothetical protein [Bdellovibrionales bacterium]
MRKELIIQAKLDSSEFDKSFERMNARLREAYGRSEMNEARTATSRRLAEHGMGGLLSPASRAEQERDAYSKRRELDHFIREQTRHQEKSVASYRAQLDALKAMREQHEKIVAAGREDSALRQKIVDAEARARRDTEAYKTRDRAINAALEEKRAAFSAGPAGILQAYREEGMRGAMGQAGFGSFRGGMGTLGAAAGKIGSAMVLAGEAGRIYYSANRQAELAMGSATTGLAGRDVADVFGGRASRMQAYAPERARALQGALYEERGQRRMDTMVAGGLGLGAAGGALMAAGGAATGGLGLVAAGAVAGGAALYKLFTDDVARNRLLGSLGPEGNRFQKQYEAGRAREFASNMRSLLEAQEQQDPLKRMTLDDFYANYRGFLGSQRRMGLSDAQFYGTGGFMDRSMAAGFGRQEAMGAAEGVMGAGGSTRMARDSVLALRLMRNMDLSNAPGVLGKMSGTLGDSGQTRSATVAVIAEGMRLGLDRAEFAEEQRRFVAAAAEVVARSGAVTATGAAAVAGGLSPFLSQTTTAGMAAGRAAYEEVQGRTGQYSGPRGAMQAAGILRDPALAKLGLDQRASLAAMSEERLRAGGAEVESMAADAGLSLEEFQRRAIGVKRGAVSLRGDTDQAVESLRQRLGARGLLGATADRIRQEAPDLWADVGRLQSRMSMEDPEAARRLGTLGGESMALGLAQPARIAADRERMALAEARIEGGPGGRVADIEAAAEARTQQATLGAFRDMREDIVRAAEGSRQLADNILAASMAITQALERARSGGLAGEDLGRFLQKQAEIIMGPQQQAGKGGR